MLPTHLRLSYSCSWQFTKCGLYQSATRYTNPAAAVGHKQHVKGENVMNTSLSQAHQLSDAASAVDPIPILDSLDPKVSASRSLDLTDVQRAEDVALDKTPLPFEDIPGPVVLKLWEKYWKYVPLFGQLSWNRNITPLKYLFNEYGPVVRLNGPLTGDIVLIHRPEHIAKVFEQEGDSPARSTIDVLHHYRCNYRKYRFAGPYCAQGAQNLEWIQTKKSLETPITEQLNKQLSKLEMTCDELIQRIRQIKNRQDEVPSTFNQELSRWSMECFWTLMLSKKLGFLDSTGYNENSEATRFIEALGEAHLYMSRCETGFQVWRFLETPFSKKLFQACDIIDGIIGKYIRIAQSNIRGEAPSKHDEDKQIRSTILENLLVKQRMNPDDVSTLLMDMIILGAQATSNSQAFLLYYLAKNPRVQRNLFDEVKSKVKDNIILTTKTFESMPYLDACIKECLRLRPAFPYITRFLPVNLTLHGYKIPKGTYLIMANQISSQREENFEDAEKFKPERWLSPNKDSYPKNSYLPFGKGLRSCLGENMAKLEMMLLTTKIIQEFKVEYDYANIKSSFMMMNVPNKPLRFRFVDRS